MNTPKIKELGPDSHVLLRIFENKSATKDFDQIFDHITDINERDSNGQTCLHKAMSKKYESGLVIKLLNRGAKINSRDSNGNTPLHCLGLNKSIQRKKIKLLLENGADLYMKNNEGKMALVYLIK